MKRLGFMIGVFLIALFLARGVWQLYGKMTLLREEKNKKERELAALVKERERLESEIAYLQGTSALEREAKLRLNYKKSGEEVVIVAPEEQHHATVTEIAPAKSLFERIKDFLSFW